MAIKQINYSDLRVGDEVTLKLREGESVIVGKVTEETAGGGLQVRLTNNRNSVVIYEDTNFRIFADRGPTIQEVLDGFAIGTVFDYRNKYDNVIRWVKSGEDRVTRIADDRPAYSLSISEGFTDQGDAEDRVEVVY